MFCPKCGEILRDGARKCPVCGARLNGKSTVNRTPVHTAPASHSYDHTHYECERSDCTQVNFACAHSSTAPSFGFPEAIRLFFARNKDFSGRSCRSEFWWPMLMLTIVYVILGPLGFLWILATLIPAAAVSIRRLHDVGVPGVGLVLLLIPVVGFILFLVLVCRPSGPTNQWGEPR